jgi:hypothetical protein
MTLAELLNSDLSTLGREARHLFDWWVDELAKLVPASVKRLSVVRGRPIRFTALGLDAIDDATTSHRNYVVTIAHENVLQREIATPPMTSAELRRMLALNSERYLPLPGDSVILATAVRDGRGQDGMMLSEIAAFPIARAQALADAMRAGHIVPRAVRLADQNGRIDPRFNFLPAMRASGLVQSSGSHVRSWWIVVGALVALVVATAIWRDVVEVDRLQTLVDAQRPAVGVAQRITAQMQALDAIARRAAQRRGDSDPLLLLGLTTAAVPDGAWVQRLAWNGVTMRLTGYRSRDTDVAAALRKMPGIVTVKSAQTDTMTEIAAGQPFDLVATMRTD